MYGLHSVAWGGFGSGGARGVQGGAAAPGGHRGGAAQGGGHIFFVEYFLHIAPEAPIL